VEEAGKRRRTRTRGGCRSPTRPHGAGNAVQGDATLVLRPTLVVLLHGIWVRFLGYRLMLIYFKGNQ
jgi:hypothetical protein